MGGRGGAGGDAVRAGRHGQSRRARRAWLSPPWPRQRPRARRLRPSTALAAGPSAVPGPAAPTAAGCAADVAPAPLPGWARSRFSRPTRPCPSSSANAARSSACCSADRSARLPRRTAATRSSGSPATPTPRARSRSPRPSTAPLPPWRCLRGPARRWSTCPHRAVGGSRWPGPITPTGWRSRTADVAWPTAGRSRDAPTARRRSHPVDGQGLGLGVGPGALAVLCERTEERTAWRGAVRGGVEAGARSGDGWDA